MSCLKAQPNETNCPSTITDPLCAKPSCSHVGQIGASGCNDVQLKKELILTTKCLICSSTMEDGKLWGHIMTTHFRQWPYVCSVCDFCCCYYDEMLKHSTDSDHSLPSVDNSSNFQYAKLMADLVMEHCRNVSRKTLHVKICMADLDCILSCDTISIDERIGEGVTQDASEVEANASHSKPVTAKDHVLEVRCARKGMHNNRQIATVDINKIDPINKLQSSEEKQGTTAESQCNSAGVQEKLSATAIRNGNILKFFETASPEMLQSIPSCSARAVNFILEMRPFQTYQNLKSKLLHTKGISTNVLSNVIERAEMQEDLDALLSQCDYIAKKLKSDVQRLINGKKSRDLIRQPEIINEKMELKPYQILGLNWLILLYDNDLNAILADEMGLGKTIQVIAFLAYLKQKRVDGIHLIVVPSSTLDNWLMEINLWCPALTVKCYYGSQEDRKFLRNQLLSNATEESEKIDVIVGTYATVISTPDDRDFFFKKCPIRCVVFDEAHMLKNYTTNRYQSLMRIPAERKILLTGTPLQNNLVELVSLLYFVMPEIFEEFTDELTDILKFFSSKGNLTSITFEDFEREKIDKAKTMLKPFVLRRLKLDVLDQLPTKKVEVRRCMMPLSQANLYSSVLDECRQQALSSKVYSVHMNGMKKKKAKLSRDCLKLHEKDEEFAFQSSSDSSASAVGLLMRLRKVANHSLLARRRYTDNLLNRMAKCMLKDPDHLNADVNLIYEDLLVMSDFELHKLCEKYSCISRYSLNDEVITESAKFIHLDCLLKDFESQGSKVLLFSQFVIMLDIIESYMEIRKYNYIRLDGNTPVVERQALIERFQTDPELFVFLLSTRAGGLGINLTAANVIILHDIAFNPYVDKQAEDRCHRVGQTKEVTVVKLIAENTIEENMFQCAERKLKLEQQLTEGDNEDNSKDVEMLLKEALNLTTNDCSTSLAVAV